jgi:hypothetical protein
MPCRDNYEGYRDFFYPDIGRKVISLKTVVQLPELLFFDKPGITGEKTSDSDKKGEPGTCQQELPARQLS